MRAVAVLFAALTLPAVAFGQTGRGATTQAQEANAHYARGWNAIRSDSWSDAVREFEAAVQSDPKFALAYYSLGRAEMGLKDFPKAISAYTKAREIFEGGGAEQFTSQMDARQRINDRILEYQNALNQANNQAGGRGGSTQSTSLYARELQTEIQRLEQARNRNENVNLSSDVPYYVPLALGAAYFRNGQTADAEREYKAAIAANNASGETHNNLAVLYLTTGRYDEAEAEVKAAEKVGFKVPEALKGDISAGKKRGRSRG